MPVTLDVVMESIVTAANEHSEDVNDSKYNENENICRDKILVDESKIPVPEKNKNETRLGNCKIIIKDLKESQLYHKLINEVEEKERLKPEKCEDIVLCHSPKDVDKKKKKEKHKSKKKKKKSQNKSR